MQSTLVYDPDGILSSAITAAAALDRSAVVETRAAHALRLAERATVVVLVAGSDRAAGLGFLASLGELRSRRLVLIVSDARYHRRLLMRAIRRGATVLLVHLPDAPRDGEPFSCPLRDYVHTPRR